MARLKFAQWFRNHTLLEYGDIKDADISHIQLTGGEPEEFDEDDAREECENAAERRDFYHGCDYTHYDDPTDDPDFDAQTVEDWEEENPPPNQEDFENEEDGGKAFQQAEEEWSEERDEADSNYRAEVSAWEERQEEAKQQAEECESEARWEWVSDCIREKENEWSNDHGEDRQGDLAYNFKIEGDNYTVDFSKGDRIKVGNSYLDNVWGITFSGPRGFSTTNKGYSNLVYTQMLMGCKKFMEQVEPDVLQFSPAEPAMGLVYRKFVDMFLKETFIQASKNTLVRKEALHKAIENESPEFQQETWKKILQAHKDSADAEASVREEKNRQRAMYQKAKEMQGGLAALKDTWQERYMPVIVLDAVFQSARASITVLAMDAYSDRAVQRQASGDNIKSVEEAMSSQGFVQMVHTFIERIIKYPMHLSMLTDRAVQELRRIAPQEAERLMAAMQRTKGPTPGQLFDEPQQQQPPQDPLTGWRSTQ